MAQLEQILKRKDGSEVKLVATAYYGRGLHLSIGVDVFRRDREDEAWRLTSDQPHPDWRKMSVAEYIKHGRSERLQTAWHGEIFKVSNMLRAQLGH